MNKKEMEKDREARAVWVGDREAHRAKEKLRESNKKRRREAEINGPQPPGLGPMVTQPQPGSPAFGGVRCSSYSPFVSSGVGEHRRCKMLAYSSELLYFLNHTDRVNLPTPEIVSTETSQLPAYHCPWARYRGQWIPPQAQVHSIS